MTYKQFTSKSKYVYYSDDFNEIILGGVKASKIGIFINKFKLATLTYIGEF